MSRETLVGLTDLDLEDIKLVYHRRWYPSSCFKLSQLILSHLGQFQRAVD